MALSRPNQLVATRKDDNDRSCREVREVSDGPNRRFAGLCAV